MKIYLFFLFIIFSNYLIAAQPEDFILKADASFKNKDYPSAFDNYILAENFSLKNNLSPKKIYEKLADLCEKTYNYDSALFYWNKFGELAEEKSEMEKSADNIMKIYDLQSNKKQPISLTKNKPTGFKLKPLKENTTIRQNFKVSKPVAVTGVRGADELHIDQTQTVENLEVNLSYYPFNEDEINNFIDDGNLNKLNNQNDNKNKFNLTELIVTEDEEINDGEITAQILINNFKSKNCYCDINELNNYPVIFIDNQYSNKEIASNRINYINFIFKILSLVTNRPDLKYKVDIFYDENPNAFTTPSGYVFISENFLTILENEEELAAILAHELSHITLRHNAKSIGKSKVINGVLDIFVKNKNDMIKKGVNAINNTLIKNSFSRNEEYEADKQAVKFLIKLGYNPESLISVFKKFEINNRIKNKLAGSFLNNHPLPEDRINNLMPTTTEFMQNNSISEENIEIRKMRFENYMKFTSKIDSNVIKTAVTEEKEQKKEEKKSSDTGAEKKDKQKNKFNLKSLFSKF